MVCPLYLVLILGTHCSIKQFMLGILVILATSWLLLYLMEKKSITALGLLPVTKRLSQFGIGFALTAVLCVLSQLLEASLQSSHWVWNESFSAKLLFQSAKWDFISVTTEELLFRGALLYILIGKIGAYKSVLVSAIAFGVYHWFSYGVFGQIIPMVFTFLATGLMGYALAYSFAKTKSIILPIGLHFGWNFTFNSVFSKGPLGDVALIQNGGTELIDWASLLNFSVGMLLVPVVILIVVKHFIPVSTSK